MKQLLATLTFLALFSFKTNDQKERTYTFLIPEHLVNAYYSIVNGGSIDNLTVGQAKELATTFNSQIIPQAQKYHYDDSVAQSKVKIDSTHKK